MLAHAGIQVVPLVPGAKMTGFPKFAGMTDYKVDF
jgi:hypothetical protein